MADCSCSIREVDDRDGSLVHTTGCPQGQATDDGPRCACGASITVEEALYGECWACGDFEDHFEYHEDEGCTMCGGEGVQDPDDPAAEGYGLIPARRAAGAAQPTIKSSGEKRGCRSTAQRRGGSCGRRTAPTRLPRTLDSAERISTTLSSQRAISGWGDASVGRATANATVACAGRWAPARGSGHG